VTPRQQVPGKGASDESAPASNKNSPTYRHRLVPLHARDRPHRWRCLQRL